METEDGLDVLINRTNNPLERFNKKLKAEIPTHPTMQVSSFFFIIVVANYYRYYYYYHR